MSPPRPWRDRERADKLKRAHAVAELVAGGARIAIDDAGRPVAILNGTTHDLAWTAVIRSFQIGLVTGRSLGRLELTPAGRAALDGEAAPAP